VANAVGAWNFKEDPVSTVGGVLRISAAAAEDYGAPRQVGTVVAPFEVLGGRGGPHGPSRRTYPFSLTFDVLRGDEERDFALVSLDIVVGGVWKVLGGHAER